MDRDRLLPQAHPRRATEYLIKAAKALKAEAIDFVTDHGKWEAAA
jgi:hypothetical protein